MTAKSWSKTSIESDNSRGKTWNFNFDNGVAQELVLTLDYLNSKMIPTGCYKPNLKYNIMIIDKTGQVIKKEAISTKMGYGLVHFEKLKPGSYTIKVVNFGDTSSKGDFQISAYAESNPVSIEYSNSYLLKDIEKASEKDVVSEKYDHGKVKSQSFFNKKTGDLTISFKKEDDAKPFDARFQFAFESEDVTPWDRIRSNYEWQTYSRVEFVEGYEKKNQKSSKSKKNSKAKNADEVSGDAVNLFKVDVFCPT